ncbi:S-adenosyl-L-methionine-dependent methyltransferase [Mollisia scopiformis]|uniref:S-adenosyl-L-methionine-dependent methyltransferase n=1 Tax=Mollisia scopiformis TaxID=149040 RepID=A0A194XS21_MOLSC|nr:S-adenosyl-L-methionine-dependent methyltransferase [Mollisia scopiformis]KUJ23095.1 S-adenosyl-L-methionine-dependent methyltransferase [Mollisia scopiformis]
MAQNIYDSENFFKNYIQLPRQVKGLAGTPEWSALKSLLPDPKGTQFLDLGCGFGWVCRWSRENGSVAAHGVDVSEKMLCKARSFPTDSAITYTRADLETFELPPNTYDIAFSSLSFHYLKNLPSLIQQIYKTLTPGGALVFSVEHPVYTAPQDPKVVPGSEYQTIWSLASYLDEGPRISNWLADGVVKQHRTISTYATILLEAGFALAALEEWGPTQEQIKASPHTAFSFLLLKAVKAK